MDKLKTRIKYHLTISGRLKSQLSFAERSESQKIFAGKRVLIPLIETSHYQYHHILGIGKALQLRGAEVKVLVCGEVLNGCEIKSVRNEGDKDPCWNCRFNVEHILPLYGLETLKIQHIMPASEITKIRSIAAKLISERASIQRCEINLDRSVQDSLIRYYYGAVPVDEKQVGKVRQDHSMSALLTAEVARRIDEEWNPNIVLCNMSCYSTFEAFYKHYSNNGERFRQISIDPMNYFAITFNQLDLYKLNRFLSYRESRISKLLSDSERALLNEFLNKRFAGHSEIFLREAYFKLFSKNEILAQLNLDIEKQNIFLFSNIYWDVGLSEMAGLYPGVISFVLCTIELLKNKPNIHLYIKPHPGEVFDSSSSLKGISQIVREKYPQLPANVTVIEPEWKINTYDLFPHIDLGVIFNGTVGLEMMLAGIPVVSTGATTHYGLGFAAEPYTEAEYINLLLGEKEFPKYKKEDLELFAYFYFIRSRMPFSLVKQVYGAEFAGFAFESLDELLPGKDAQLDHLCNCIMDLKHIVVENWPVSTPQKKQASNQP